jgi:hypothetical protein
MDTDYIFEYDQETIDNIIFDFRCCSSPLETIAEQCQGKILFHIAIYGYLGKYKIDFLSSLFRDGMFIFTNSTPSEQHWIKRLFVECLHTDSCNKTTRLLLKHHVFSNMDFLDDYQSILVSEYDNEEDEEETLSEIFVRNVSDGNMFLVKLQMQFSVMECIRNIVIFLDSDQDCHLTLLNHLAHYPQPLAPVMIKFLMWHHFTDERTNNSYSRRIFRPLSCVETALVHDNLELAQFTVKFRSEDFFQHVVHYFTNHLKTTVKSTWEHCAKSARCIDVILGADFSTVEHHQIIGILEDPWYIADRHSHLVQAFLQCHYRTVFRDAIFNTLPNIDDVPYRYKPSNKVFALPEMVESIMEFL